MKLTQEEIFGYVGSAIFCGLLLLILFLVYLQTEIKATEEGVLVNFGTVDWAAGTFEPEPEGDALELPTEDTAPQPLIAETSTVPPVITQDVDQTVAINAAKQKEEQKRLEEQKKEAERQRQVEEQRKRAEEEQRKRDLINQQVSGAFAAGTTKQGSEGTADSGKGNQGSSQGNAAVGAYQGVGGSGTFSLSGRSLRGNGVLPSPAYTAQEEGRIVLDITVDAKGNVIDAQIGKGTTITNESLRRAARKAASEAKFNEIQGNNQSGTITYIYKLN